MASGWRIGEERLFSGDDPAVATFGCDAGGVRPVSDQ
ncbi:hypothetical protein P775_26290 [Puniceibacterium antarcticum]|uniref:Uncharacterized protein n=1 Tax=Puniceibacterium antarcticum TaxID=1206336 RepID=A0A2G8QZW6_9RHOB|nr:hypothetical protein P775_26290 [Puniceibacterium antarcticum]